MSLPQTKVSISRKKLSAMLRKQLDAYNRLHSKKPLTYDRLEGHLTAYYVQNEIVRYQIIHNNFDSESDINDALKRIDEKESGKWDDDLCFDGDRPLSSYLSGHYSVTSDERVAKYFEGDYIEIKNPSKVFYCFARIVEMPEEDMMMAFAVGDGLDINFYHTQYVYDIFEYYYSISGMSQQNLADKAHSKSVKRSSIGNMLTQKDKITFDKFNILAPLLGIPDRLITSCNYRIAYWQDSFSYEAGYQAAIDDFNDHRNDYEELSAFLGYEHPSVVKKLKERLALLEAECALFERNNNSQDREALLYPFFRSLGFRIIPDVNGMPDNVKPPESSRLHFAKMKITLPNGNEYVIDTDEYLDAIEKTADYAEYLLWKKTTHPEIATEDDPADTNTEYIDPDTLI